MSSTSGSRYWGGWRKSVVCDGNDGADFIVKKMTRPSIKTVGPVTRTVSGIVRLGTLGLADLIVGTDLNEDLTHDALEFKTQSIKYDKTQYFTMEYGTDGRTLEKGYYTETEGGSNSYSFTDKGGFDYTMRDIKRVYDNTLTHWNSSNYSIKAGKNCKAYAKCLYSKIIQDYEAKKARNYHRYIIINGTNGYDITNASPKLLSAIDARNDCTITVCEIAGNNKFGLVYSDGRKYCEGPKEFEDKMMELNGCDIRNITLKGGKDIWGIVTKNGVCYGRFRYEKHGGPLDAINKHQGKIVCVANAIDGWVVIYGRNGWVSKGLSKELKDRIRSTNNDGKEINFVTLGNSSDKYVIHDEYGWQWRYSTKNQFFQKMKATERRLVSIF